MRIAGKLLDGRMISDLCAHASGIANICTQWVLSSVIAVSPSRYEPIQANISAPD